MNEEKKESIDYLVSSLKVMIIGVLNLERGKTKFEAACSEAAYARNILTEQAADLAERNERQKK